jgi:Protein of unknown function (DUF3592)
VAAVPLATTGGLPLSVPVPVQCKGVPRPFGLVVARSGDAVLWPSSPAVGGRPSATRPAGVEQPAALPPAPAPSSVEVRPLRERHGAWAGLVGLGFLGLVAVVSWVSAERVDERLDTWPRAAASVVDGEVTDCSVQVAFETGGEEAGGERREMAVPVGDCRPLPEGDGYQVLVDPDDPDHVLLVEGRYDVATPVVWAGAVAVATLCWTWSTVRHRRRVLELVAGEWRLAAADPDDEGSALRASSDPVGTARCWSLASVATSGRTLVVAGPMEPGATFVTSQTGDRWVTEHTGRSRPRLDLPFLG